ncbi:HNH endonuclease [Pseudomonas sp. R1-18]|uniref:HNH endonuclease n=1 Tax=Pseudomonas sp. R1-18 TaxID=1632772 RepID=UPI003DA8C647
MEPTKSKIDWSDAEIQAAVNSYTQMLQREQLGIKINKAHENRMLREQALASRTQSSIEFRMQNISAVLADLERPWIKGYPPAKNVGANVKKKILSALEVQGAPTPEDHHPTADERILERRAAKLEGYKLTQTPKGILKPQIVADTGKTYIRDPEVRAWVRQQALGVCEGCGKDAPFEKNGLPFLEVHHVKHLAHGGSDLVTNAVALCPNCHRRCHHSSDKEAFSKSLYERVKRLVVEP